MRKYIPIVCLALCAGLFCFLFFGNAGQEAGRNNYGESGENTASGGNYYENSKKSDNSSENQSGSSASGSREGEMPGGGEEGGGEKAPQKSGQQNEPKSPKESEKGSSFDASQNAEKKNGGSGSDEGKSIDLSIRIPGETASYRKDLRDMAEEVLRTLKIARDGFEYHHPQVKDGLHLGVKLQVFAENGDGDETLYRYLNDAGWMSGNDYDASARTVREKWSLGKDISKTKIILELKAFDLRDGTVDVFDLIWENGKSELLSMETKS